MHCLTSSTTALSLRVRRLLLPCFQNQLCRAVLNSPSHVSMFLCLCAAPATRPNDVRSCRHDQGDDTEAGGVADAVALVSGGEGCCPSLLYVDGQSSCHDRGFATERRLLCTHDEFSISLARSLPFVFKLCLVAHVLRVPLCIPFPSRRCTGLMLECQ